PLEPLDGLLEQLGRRNLPRAYERRQTHAVELVVFGDAHPCLAAFMSAFRPTRKPAETSQGAWRARKIASHACPVMIASARRASMARSIWRAVRAADFC